MILILVMGSFAFSALAAPLCYESIIDGELQKIVLTTESQLNVTRPEESPQGPLTFNFVDQDETQQSYTMNCHDGNDLCFRIEMGLGVTLTNKYPEGSVTMMISDDEITSLHIHLYGVTFDFYSADVMNRLSNLERESCY